MPSEQATQERNEYQALATDAGFAARVQEKFAGDLAASVAAYKQSSSREWRDSVDQDARNAAYNASRVSVQHGYVGMDQVKLMADNEQAYLEENFLPGVFRDRLAQLIPTYRPGDQPKAQAVLEQMGTTEESARRWFGEFLQKCRDGQIDFSDVSNRCVSDTLGGTASFNVRVGNVRARLIEGQIGKSGKEVPAEVVLDLFVSLSDRAGNNLRVKALERNPNGPLRKALTAAGLDPEANPEVICGFNVNASRFTVDGRNTEIGIPAGTPLSVDLEKLKAMPLAQQEAALKELETGVAEKAAASFGAEPGVVLKASGIQMLANLGRVIAKGRASIGVKGDLSKTNKIGSTSVRLDLSFPRSTLVTKQQLAAIRENRNQVGRAITAGRNLRGVRAVVNESRSQAAAQAKGAPAKDQGRG